MLSVLFKDLKKPNLIQRSMNMAAKHKSVTQSLTKKSSLSSKTRIPSTSKVTRSATKRTAPLKLVKNVNLSHLRKSCNKTQLLSLLHDMTGQPRKEIQHLLEALHQLMTAHMKKQGPGEFVMPGMLKMKIKHKPATKAKKGINPFTGEPTTFKAKPARNVVKIMALKKLKELVN